MRILEVIVLCLFLFATGQGYALQPDEILVIANSDSAESVRIAQYYCAKRQVPAGNILALPLGTPRSSTITRDNYEKQLAEPIRQKLSSPEFAGKIRCLLTTYAVPVKVGKRAPLKGREEKLKQLKKQQQRTKKTLEALEQSGVANTSRDTKGIKRNLAQLQSRIDYIVGKETEACVDSELSMVLSGDYKLYRWQPNMLKSGAPSLSFNTIMVSRLDGPGFRIAKGLVDKAIAAEKTGLRGVAYIDSRGIADDKKLYSSGHFDQSLRDLAVLTRLRTKMTVKQQRTEELFTPGSCPRTAVYCGWYSLK